MSLHRLNCSNPVNNVAWSNSNMDILVFLMNGDLLHFSHQKIENKLDSFSYTLTGQTR